MKKHLAFVLLFLLYGTSLRPQLLWKISGSELQKPSYIFGCYNHVPIESIDEISGLKTVWETTEQVCGVTTVNDAVEAEKINLDLPEGTTFLSLFKEEEQLLLRSFLKIMYNMDADKPPFCQTSPLGMLYLLVVVDYSVSAEDLFDFDDICDISFSDSLQKLALERNIPVKGLISKTANQNFHKLCLYLDMPTGKQKKVLLDYILHFSKEYDAMIQELEAYQTQNLDTIRQHVYMSSLLRKNYWKTYGNEVRKWADSIPDIIKTRSTLIVLPTYALLDMKGMSSIIRRLKGKGYIVEPVESKTER